MLRKVQKIDESKKLMIEIKNLKGLDKLIKGLKFDAGKKLNYPIFKRIE